MPYKIPALAGKPYSPSNGMEGEAFKEDFCYRCVHDDPEQPFDHPDACDILGRSLRHRLGDEDYPAEWVHDDEGRPVCTAFQARE